MPKKSRIRVLALAVVKNDNRILASPGYDRKKKRSFYRLLGGGIDFGERAEDALVREFREELGQDITVVKFLKVLENLFSFEGEEGHEICFIFEAEFVDKGLYAMDRLPLIEESFHGRYAKWVDPREAIDVFPPGSI